MPDRRRREREKERGFWNFADLKGERKREKKRVNERKERESPTVLYFPMAHERRKWGNI